MYANSNCKQKSELDLNIQTRKGTAEGCVRNPLRWTFYFNFVLVLYHDIVCVKFGPKLCLFKSMGPKSTRIDHNTELLFVIFLVFPLLHSVISCYNQPISSCRSLKLHVICQKHCKYLFTRYKQCYDSSCSSAVSQGEKKHGGTTRGLGC